MKSTVDKFDQELKLISAGLITPKMIENVFHSHNRENIYSMASIRVVDQRTLELSLFDKSFASHIEKVLYSCDLGIGIVSFGTIIKINVSAPTEEKRKSLVKLAKQIEEKYKVTIRNLRHAANNNIAKEKKSKVISEAVANSRLKDIQSITDSSIKEIDKLFQEKEKQLSKL